MKTSGFVALALFTAVSMASAETSENAPSRWSIYARASAVVAFPGDFDTAAGGALAVGVSLDRVHSLEAEIIHFNSSDGGEDVNFTPILATYHYSLPVAPKLTLKLGGSVGATRESSEWYWSGTFYGGSGHYKMSDTALTYGASAGISYAWTERLSFDGTVKALRMEKTDLTTAGGIAIVTLGVNFRF